MRGQVLRLVRQQLQGFDRLRESVGHHLQVLGRDLSRLQILLDVRPHLAEHGDRLLDFPLGFFEELLLRLRYYVLRLDGQRRPRSRFPRFLSRSLVSE